MAPTVQQVEKAMYMYVTKHSNKIDINERQSAWQFAREIIGMLPSH